MMEGKNLGIDVFEWIAIIIGAIEIIISTPKFIEMIVETYARVMTSSMIETSIILFVASFMLGVGTSIIIRVYRYVSRN